MPKTVLLCYSNSLSMWTLFIVDPKDGIFIVVYLLVICTTVHKRNYTLLTGKIWKNIPGRPSYLQATDEAYVIWKIDFWSHNLRVYLKGHRWWSDKTTVISLLGFILPQYFLCRCNDEILIIQLWINFNWWKAAKFTTYKQANMLAGMSLHSMSTTGIETNLTSTVCGINVSII